MPAVVVKGHKAGTCAMLSFSVCLMILNEVLLPAIVCIVVVALALLGRQPLVVVCD